MLNRTVIHNARGEVDRLTRRSALLEFPPAIYAARLHDGTIKIGWTTRVYRRLTELGPKPELLALKPATLEDEQAIHAALTEHRARGAEYYHPTTEVMAVVNELRDEFGLPHIAA